MKGRVVITGTAWPLESLQHRWKGSVGEVKSHCRFLWWMHRGKPEGGTARIQPAVWRGWALSVF